MILDYKNDREFALANGVVPENRYGEVYYNSGPVCEGVTFRNFYHLCLEEVTFCHCVFENCHEVEPRDCRMIDCVFVNVDEVFGHYTDFLGCSFRQCCADGPLLTIDSKGRVYNCTFDTITALGEDGYVIYSAYGPKEDVEMVERCKFIDCKVESEDGALCYCSCDKPFPSNKTMVIDNVDYDTCEGVEA